MAKAASETIPLLFEKKNEKYSSFVNIPQRLKEGKTEAEIYWQKCLDIIKDNVDPQIFNTWFSPIEALRWSENKLTVKVPSQFFFEWIEENYYSLLQSVIIKILGNDAKLQYEVIMDEPNENLKKRTIKVPALRHPPQNQSPQPALPFSKPPDNNLYPTFLNSRYTFDNFVTGDSNQLASSAAKAVSLNPGGTRYNPLVVYGNTGLGKTHLIQAIGNQISYDNPKNRVMYTNSERFTQEFINAIQNNKLTDFVNFYRSVDILIVDDIQFLGGKEKTQDNFFHTFNALHQSGKQLVLTSDKPPKELKDVDERLISRFQWGLTVDIQAPDLEMRMAILQKKSEDEGVELPAEIIEFIAKHVTSNMRELEGILISIIAKISLDNRRLDLDLVKEVILGITDIEPKPLTIDTIKEIVAEYYNMDVEKLESKTRKHEVVLARQMSMYLAKQFTQLSLKSIGASFGGKDHSTVLHSCQNIENYLTTDKNVKGAFNELLKKLRRD